MPRKTNFVLTEAQERKLVAYLIEKRQSLLQDNSNRLRLDIEAWQRYWMDVSRRAGISESIYGLSNIPIPVFAMTVEHFASRIEESTSADEPYWHFEAIGTQEQKARNYTDYFGWKLDQGGVHQSMLDNQLSTVIQSANVMKATYARDEIQWVDMEAQVLHDRGTGNPIETISDGPIIQGEDLWEEHPDPVGVIEHAKAAIAGALGMEPPEVPTRQHLKSDPSVIFDPARHYWAPPPGGIKRSQVIFSGAKSEHVRFDRIYCAMDAESFEKSDVMELQDRAFDWFRSNWLERPWATWAQFEPNLKTGDTSPKTGQVDTGLATGNPSTAQRVENRVYDHINPVRRIAEFWCERDVLGNGTMAPQRFVCWLDIDLNVLVNYEWQAKVCPDLKRPYTVTALCKPPNRWCGKSIWERGKPLFEAVDRLFNGEFYRTLQQANPPKGGDPGAAKEEPDNIGYDPTKYWELKPGRKIEELMQYAQVPDTNQRTQTVMEFIIFWIQLWLGISNIAQGDYAAVPANSTATGITKTLQEASLLGRRWIRRKIEADQEHLTKLVKIIIATIKEDQQEIYEFTEDDERKTAEIMGAEVRTLNIHVTVIEQQHFKEEDINRCKAGLQALDQYYAQLNPDVRKVMQPFYVEILEDLGFKNAANLLPHFDGVPITSEMGGALTMGPDGKPTLPPTETDKPAPPPPAIKGSISIAAKLDQLSPEERTQVFGEVGVQEPPGGAPKTVAPPHGPKDPNPQPKAAAK